MMNEWFANIIVLACAWSIAALAFDLVAGHAGMFSLASPGLMALGAYTYALLTLTAGCSSVVALVAGMAATAVMAMLTSLCIARLYGDLFALATFGVYRIVYDLAYNLEDWTGGAIGLRGLPPIYDTEGRTLAALGFGGLSVCATLMLYHCVTRSQFGRALRAVRDDSVAASALGFSPFRVRVTVYTLHGAMLGLAGIVVATQQTAVSPMLFSFNLGLLVIAMAVIGGLGSWRGVITGVAVVLLVSEIVRFYCSSPWLAGAIGQMITDLMFVGFLVLRPQGLLGTYFRRA